MDDLSMNTKQKVLAILIAMILVVPSITGTVSATDSATSIVAEPQFALELVTSEDANDSSIINVVVTIKDIKQELLAVEYELNFDTTLVEGVITECGAPMDAFMTVTPMYIMSYNGMEVPASRYEQICYYDVTEGQYECRFCDLLRYPLEKHGQKYKGLINDGDLVVTIQFRKLDPVDKNEEITFTMTNIKGTTKDGIKIVPGIATRALIKDEEVEITEGVTTGKEEETTKEETTKEETMKEVTTTGEAVTIEKVTTGDIATTENVMPEEVTATEEVATGEVTATEEVVTGEDVTTVTIDGTETTEERLDKEGATGTLNIEGENSNNRETSGERLEEEPATEETTAEVPQMFASSKPWFFLGLFFLVICSLIYVYKRKK
jgi:hypothetical protein